MVGANGFEPSTSWSRNRLTKILKALSGVAYETERANFSLSVVRKLYLEVKDLSRRWREISEVLCLSGWALL